MCLFQCCFFLSERVPRGLFRIYKYPADLTVFWWAFSHSLFSDRNRYAEVGHSGQIPFPQKLQLRLLGLWLETPSKVVGYYQDNYLPTWIRLQTQDVNANQFHWSLTFGGHFRSRPLTLSFHLGNNEKLESAFWYFICGSPHKTRWCH